MSAPRPASHRANFLRDADDLVVSRELDKRDTEVPMFYGVEKIKRRAALAVIIATVVLAAVVAVAMYSLLGLVVP